MADRIAVLSIDNATTEAAIQTWIQTLTIAAVYGFTSVTTSNSMSRLVLAYKDA